MTNIEKTPTAERKINPYHFPRRFFFRTLSNKVESIKFPNLKRSNPQIWTNNGIIATLWPGTWNTANFWVEEASQAYTT